jgi:hypothetical protein
VKRIAVLLLLVLYGFTTIGATIHLHYCMGKYAGWSLWHTDKNEKCGKCGMNGKKDGCCHDKHKQVKLKAEHQKTETTQYNQILDGPGLLTPVASFLFAKTGITQQFQIRKTPPAIPQKRLYILNCFFLI